MNPEYKRHAYARSILYELRLYLADRYIAAEAAPKAIIVCEEVLYAEREVPPDALLRMLIRLKKMEDEEQRRMAEYEMLRRPIEDEVQSEPKAAEKRKRKAE